MSGRTGRRFDKRGGQACERDAAPRSSRRGGEEDERDAAGRRCLDEHKIACR